MQLAVPKKRAEHHWIFQPLALVNRDDTHQIFVAFQPQLLCLVFVAWHLSSFAEPLEQPRQAGMGAAGDMRQLGQMQ